VIYSITSEFVYDACMDVVDGFFDGPRARGAFALRAMMSPPWSVSIEDRAPLSVVAVTAGDAVVTCAGDRPVALAAGQVALLRGPDPYVFADRADRHPTVVVLPDQRCASPADGRSMSAEMDLGVRTWGNDAHGTTTMLIGSYHGDGEIGRRLTDALPPLAVLSAEDGIGAVLDLLGAEIDRDLPGQPVVLDRLLDLLVVHALRAWFARPDADRPAWLDAHGDAEVARALAALHAAPARPWRLGELAASVGLSRAALARRFQGAVGESPIAYLAAWRLALAADLLLDPDATVTRVAREVGYANPFTFSTAFKRAYGHSPRDHHRRATA
jgi:AraC-like DNA-binding protein